MSDTDNQLQQIIDQTQAKSPYPDFQWIEDRFWIWIHYALQKIGRGEYLEAFDFLGFLRMVVFGPLLHVQNNSLPRGVRKVETKLIGADLSKLKLTIPYYNRQSLISSLRNAVSLYRQLRAELYDSKVYLQNDTDNRVMMYFDEIESKK